PIGLDLMRDLAIGPEALGALTGAFFFGFSAMQIPCGVLFDHFGPRRTVACMLILATAGAAIFTLAPSWPILLTGRALMGAGFGVMLIGSMVVISRWFPPDRFSTLAGIVLSIGLVGNLLATTPLAWGTELIGWRGVFAMVVVFAAIAGIGFLSASSTMIMTHGRGIFPDRLIGRGMATMNTSVMLGVACMQTLSGFILAAFVPLADGARTETAYRTLFGFMCLVLL